MSDSDWNISIAYTADISTKMRIPVNLMAHGSLHGDLQTNNHYAMRVPDRIVVSEQQQESSKYTPRELLMDQSMMKSGPKHVRIDTPPRSIKLGDAHFPSAEKTRTPKGQNVGGNFRVPGGGNEGLVREGHDDNSDVTYAPLFDEVQMMKKQTAKLTNKLMVFELQNQQQQRREMMMTVLVSAYFAVKFMLWINKAQ